MKIKSITVKIKDLTKNYSDNGEGGVKGYNNILDIRPAYQREFVYKEKQREAVIDTVQQSLPLNSIYWVNNGKNKMEVLDGQQRIISICQYVAGDYSIDYKYFHNLSDEEKNAILDYELMIFLCDGSDSEKLKWFNTINIAGEKLSKQELRNSVYTGEWLSDAKKYFSSVTSPGYLKGKKYIKGAPNRQDFLEQAIHWMDVDKKVEDYMAAAHKEKDAKKLWRRFEDIIDWVEEMFTEYRKEMKGVDWGALYDEFKDSTLKPEELEKEISRLMKDFDVTKKSGIYYFVLNGEESNLNIRAFNSKQKREGYETCGGVCPSCLADFDFDNMEADHINPWSLGGKTDTSNLQMLCKKCNRTKSNK